jgi:hypothetical protein
VAHDVSTLGAITRLGLTTGRASPRTTSSPTADAARGAHLASAGRLSVCIVKVGCYQQALAHAPGDGPGRRDELGERVRHELRHPPGLIAVLEHRAAEIEKDGPMVLDGRDRTALAEVLTLAADVLDLMEEEKK